MASAMLGADHGAARTISGRLSGKKWQLGETKKDLAAR
jgi:hypothetical protein